MEAVRTGLSDDKVGIEPFSLSDHPRLRSPHRRNRPPRRLRSRRPSPDRQYLLDRRDLRGLHRPHSRHHQTHPNRLLPQDRLRRDRLRAWRETERTGQPANRRRLQARFAAAGDAMEAAEVAAVIERRGGSLGRGHDPGGAGGVPRHRFTIADQLQPGRPDREHGQVLLKRAIADQQAQQVSLRRAARAFPSAERAVVVQDDLVARLQAAGFDPFDLQHVRGPAGDAPDAVIRRQPQRMPLARGESEHRLRSRPEESGAGAVWDDASRLRGDVGGAGVFMGSRGARDQVAPRVPGFSA